VPPAHGSFLGLVITVNLTPLNPDFAVSELDKLDVYSVIAEQAKTLLPSQQFIGAEIVHPVASPYVRNTC